MKTGQSFSPLFLRRYTPRWPPAGATLYSALSWHRCFVTRHSPATPGRVLRPREDSLAGRRSNKYFHFGLVLFLEPLPPFVIVTRALRTASSRPRHASQRAHLGPSVAFAVSPDAISARPPWGDPQRKGRPGRHRSRARVAWH